MIIKAARCNFAAPFFRLLIERIIMEPCKTCAYWVVADKTEQSIGSCKALPPTVLMQKIAVDSKGLPVTSAFQKQVAVTEIASAHFPITPGNEGCGYHRPLNLQ